MKRGDDFRASILCPTCHVSDKQRLQRLYCFGGVFFNTPRAHCQPEAYISSERRFPVPVDGHGVTLGNVTPAREARDEATASNSVKPASGYSL